MPGKHKKIESFHEDIVRWRATGISLRHIVERLQKAGVDTNKGKVDRYCKKKKLPPTPRQRSSGEEGPATDDEVDLNPQVALFQDELSDTAAPPPPKRPREQREHPVIPDRSRVLPAWMDVPKSPSDQATKPAAKRPAATFAVGTFVCGPLVPPPAEKPPTIPAAKSGSPTPSAPKAPPPQSPVNYPPPPPLRKDKWQPPPLPFRRMTTPPLWTPELPILEFGAEENIWSLQDSFEGTFVLGTVGSGKTSGSGRTLAHAFLEKGFGGLVLTVKEDECALWRRYCRQAGREHHLCVVEPGGKYRFNFLDYEMRRPEIGAGLIENLVDLFYTAVHSHRHDISHAQLAEFWEDAGKQLVRNVFRVLQHSRERLTLKDARKFISEAPGSRTALASGEWKEKDFGKWLHWATQAVQGTPQESVMNEARLYWLEEFPGLAETTRSCIVTGFTAMAEAFIEPAIHDLFCTDTTLSPDVALEGAIVVVNLPLKTFRTVGNFTQSIWKHMFQKTVEARSDARNATCRPIFLWADEAQYFFSNYDSLFQSTARSSRCATVYLTQSLSNFYASGGGQNARERVDGFLGNLNTKIFHCNNDPVSNHWSAEQIGRCKTYRFNSSSSTSPSNNRGLLGMFMPQTSHSAGMNEVMDYEVQPGDFMKLRTGSERFQRKVDAYFVKSGATFSNGKHFFQTVFQQEILK